MRSGWGWSRCGIEFMFVCPETVLGNYFPSLICQIVTNPPIAQLIAQPICPTNQIIEFTTECPANNPAD